jgi:hypothetical protein
VTGRVTHWLTQCISQKSTAESITKNSFGSIHGIGIVCFVRTNQTNIACLLNLATVLVNTMRFDRKQSLSLSIYLSIYLSPSISRIASTLSISSRSLSDSLLSQQTQYNGEMAAAVADAAHVLSTGDTRTRASSFQNCSSNCGCFSSCATLDTTKNV